MPEDLRLRAADLGDFGLAREVLPGLRVLGLWNKLAFDWSGATGAASGAKHSKREHQLADIQLSVTEEV